MHPIENWLREQKRLGKRVTRVALAEKVSCKPSWLTGIIKHNKTPSLKLAKRLSDETGIPLEKFVSENA